MGRCGTDIRMSTRWSIGYAFEYPIETLTASSVDFYKWRLQLRGGCDSGDVSRACKLSLLESNTPDLIIDYGPKRPDAYGLTSSSYITFKQQHRVVSVGMRESAVGPPASNSTQHQSYTIHIALTCVDFIQPHPRYTRVAKAASRINIDVTKTSRNCERDCDVISQRHYYSVTSIYAKMTSRATARDLRLSQRGCDKAVMLSSSEPTEMSNRRDASC